jgi:cytochrome c-type biogenesis protein
MLDISFAGAALAGLLSFFTPCILPMVPFYLCYLAGISMGQLRDDGGIAADAQGRLVISAILFALGVTTIFVVLGMGATAVGHVFAAWRGPLSWAAAAVLTVFGLHFLGVVRIGFLHREARIAGPVQPGTVIGAYLMGLAFGFGWTPCVGPALTAILILASTMGNIWQGGMLLLVYGLAMTAPFVLAAVFAKPFLRMMQRHRHRLAHVERIMGVMLIGFAILIVTDGITLIAQVMLDIFPGFLTLG